MHPQTPARLLHVIASQCAHWRGNPPPPCPWCPAQKRPCKRTYATAFCMSLRTSAHTGVAIRVPWLRRSTLHHCPAARTPTKLVIANQCAHWCGNPRPRRETWQAGNTLGEFVTHCEFALNSALFTPYRRSYGLPRRFAPRNDKEGGPCTRGHASVFCMSLRTSAHTGVAIRSPRRETWQAGNTLGEFVTHCEFALNSALFTPCRRRSGLPRRCAPRNDMQKHAAVCGCNCVVPGKFVTFSYSP